jgi:hypothetical protein
MRLDSVPPRTDGRRQPDGQVHVRPSAGQRRDGSVAFIRGRGKRLHAPFGRDSLVVDRPPAHGVYRAMYSTVVVRPSAKSPILRESASCQFACDCSMRYVILTHHGLSFSAPHLTARCHNRQTRQPPVVLRCGNHCDSATWRDTCRGYRILMWSRVTCTTALAQGPVKSQTAPLLQMERNVKTMTAS